MGSSPGRDKNFHVGRSSSWPASVVLHKHANILIPVRVGSSTTSKSWKSPYDPDDVGATKTLNIDNNNNNYLIQMQCWKMTYMLILWSKAV